MIFNDTKDIFNELKNILYEENANYQPAFKQLSNDSVNIKKFYLNN